MFFINRICRKQPSPSINYGSLNEEIDVEIDEKKEKKSFSIHIDDHQEIKTHPDEAILKIFTRLKDLESSDSKRKILGTSKKNCKSWIKKDLLSSAFTAGMITATWASWKWVTIETSQAAASLNLYNQNILENNMTCQGMFGNSTSSLKDICTGSDSSFQEYLEYFGTCMDELSPYCNNDGGAAFLFGVSLLALTVGVSAYLHKRYYSVMDIVPSLISSQEQTCLRTYGISVEDEDTVENMIQKIEKNYIQFIFNQHRLPKEITSIIMEYRS